MNLDDFLKSLLCNCRDRCWLLAPGMIKVCCPTCRVSFLRTDSGVQRIDMVQEELRA